MYDIFESAAFWLIKMKGHVAFDGDFELVDDRGWWGKEEISKTFNRLQICLLLRKLCQKVKFHTFLSITP